MIRHRLPAPARSSGIPGEGVQAPLGTLKLPSIHRDAVIWKTEGVGPNSLSDCGFRVIMGQKLPQALWSSSLLSHRSPK